MPKGGIKSIATEFKGKFVPPPRSELYAFCDMGALTNDKQVQLLLFLALEFVERKRKKDTFYIYCATLAILAAETLARSLRSNANAYDPYHYYDYLAMTKLLNERLERIPHLIRKPMKKRVSYNDLVTVESYRDLNCLVCDVDLNCMPTAIDHTTAGHRTYLVYGALLGFSTLMLFVQRLVLSLDLFQIEWLQKATEAYKICENYLPYVSCALLIIELLFEIGVISYAKSQGESFDSIIKKGKRPYRLLFVVASLTIILLGMLNPIFLCIMKHGLDLAHSLFIAYNKLLTMLDLRVQLKGETADGMLMPDKYKKKFLRNFNQNIVWHIVKMTATLLALCLFVAGATLTASNPIVAGFCLLVGAICALINRKYVIESLAETPGIPASLKEALGENVEDAAKKKNHCLNSSQRRQINGSPPINVRLAQSVTAKSRRIHSAPLQASPISFFGDSEAPKTGSHVKKRYVLRWGESAQELVQFKNG